MRNTSYTQALAPTRDVSASLTFMDPRLRFTYLPASEAPGDYLFFDSAESTGGGILQVAVLKGDLAGRVRYRWVGSVSDLTAKAWSTAVATGNAVYHIGLSGTQNDRTNRLFVTHSGGVSYAAFNSSTKTFGTFTTENVGVNCLVAPVSFGDVYFLQYSGTTPYCYGAIMKWTVGNPIHDTWYGRLYDTTPPKIFDAIRYSDDQGREADYVYASEEAGKRAVWVKFDGWSWSEKHYVIPMDVIDDVSQFRLSKVNRINGKTIVTGALYRSWGAPMHVYTFGPESFSLGRDLFIGSTQIDGNGKFHVLGQTALYMGPGIYYTAPSSFLVGPPNPNSVFQTQDVADIRMSAASNQPFTLSLSLHHDIDHPAVRPGSLVSLQAIVNGEASDIGTFSIDAVARQNEETGPAVTLALRSWALKDLSNWESDAPYDYWSQAKLTNNPKGMAKVIRATGQWKEENNALTTYDLNADGILYTSAKASHNAIMRAKFKRIAGDWNTRFGVGVNYSIETQAEASERLQKDLKDVVETDYGQNGIFAIYGNKENGASAGIGLYLLNTSVWTKLASAACTIPADTDTWLQIRFLDGFIQVFTRPDGTSSWTRVLSHTYMRSDALPWKSDYMGRGAIFVRNETASSMCRKIIGNLLAVDDLSAFPAADTLVIDNEIVSYSSKSNPVIG